MFSLTDPETIKRLVSQAGISPSRSSGQNFLICEEPIEVAVSALQAGPQTVTELGAGAGPLTVALLSAGFRVRAIERDEKLTPILKTAAAGWPGLELRPGDLREVPWAWEEPFSVAGNIPYNLSGWIIRRLTQMDPAPALIVLLVQKEVAERLAAAPGELSLVGLAAQLWGEVEILASVPPSCFWPAPEVTSSVVLLKPHASPLPVAERERVMDTARIFFQERRKQIGGVLQRQRGFTREEAVRVLERAGVRPEQRPQELTVEQWRKLAGLL